MNRDGQVGVADIVQVADCWRQPVTGACGDRNDLDYDGDIDVVDVQKVAASFNVVIDNVLAGSSTLPKKSNFCACRRGL